MYSHFFFSEMRARVRERERNVFKKKIDWKVNVTPYNTLLNGYLYAVNGYTMLMIREE